MKTLLRRLLGPTKRELQAKLDAATKLAESRRVKAEEGDAILCREIDRLNDELDALNHKFAPVKFENDRLVAENATLREHLASGKRYTKLLADEKERLRLDKLELLKNIERLNDRVVSLKKELDAVVATASETNLELDVANRLLAERNGYARQANAKIDELKAAIDTAAASFTATLDEQIKENQRLTRMLTEPEFLRAETERVGGIVTASADLKHWAARVMVQSFADSLEGDRAVELTFGNEDYGRFMVTIRRDDGRSLIDEMNAAQDKIRTLEIAVEASDELEQKWKRQRKSLRRSLDATERHNRDIAARMCEARQESEHVKTTCASLRYRLDLLAHALVGLTSAVADMKVSRPIPAGQQIARWHRLERAIAEADRVLGSEPSAA